MKLLRLIGPMSIVTLVSELGSGKMDEYLIVLTRGRV